MSNWSDDDTETLRRLWDEGHSGAEIARRMNTTKNAVVGRAHRMQLPSRPSPIGLPKRELDDTQREQLAQMIGKGFTRDQAAAVLRVGRDVVSREAKRLGLGGAPHRGTRSAASLDRARECTAGVRAARAAAPVAQAVPAAPPFLPPRLTKGLPAGGRGCRWPMWGDREKPTQVFCDAPACRGPYCAEHGARAFTSAWAAEPGHERRPGGFVLGGQAA